MEFRDLWRWSKIVSKEISFQSIFSLRAGSGLPRKRRTDVWRLVRNAEISTLISKILTVIFICVFGLAIFFPLMDTASLMIVPRELMVTGSVSAFLASVMFLIVFMGLGSVKSLSPC